MKCTVFTSLCFVILLFHSFCGSSLYENGLNKINVLNYNNFTEFINPNKTVFLQYYMSTCGHCQNYAPIFKKITKSVINWSQGINLAVINCNIEKNIKKCKVESVPSFGCSTNGTVQLLKSVPYNVTDLKKSLVDCILQSTERTKTLLNKDRYKGLKLIGSNTKDLLPFLLDYRGIISEPIDGILDKSFEEDHFSIRKNSFVVMQNATSAQVRSYLDSCIVPMKQREMINNHTAKPVKMPSRFIRKSGVYVDDMLASLTQMLRVDISMTRKINSEKKAALVLFLQALDMYPPFGDPYRSAIKDLLNYVNSEDTFTGKEWLEEVKKTGLPEVGPEYQTCKGSQPEYRGYSCGLWLLFHSLTVSEYLTHAKKNGSVELMNTSAPGNKTPFVPYMMNRFIPRFFSCQECGLHFAVESVTLARPNDAKYPSEVSDERMKEIKKEHRDRPLPAPKTLRAAILWLNSLHNRVNLRLAGQPSEDPMAPKVIFPSIEDCETCYSPAARGLAKSGEGSVFPDEYEELKEYLIDLYRPSSWKRANVPANVVINLYPNSPFMSFNCELGMVFGSLMFTVFCLCFLLTLLRKNPLFKFKFRTKASGHAYQPLSNPV